MIFVLLFGASLLIWRLYLLPLPAGTPWLPQQDYQLHRWKRDDKWICLGDLLVFLLLLFAGSQIGVLFMTTVMNLKPTTDPTPQQYVLQMVTYAVTSLSAMAVSWAIIFMRGKAKADPAGIVTRWSASDIRLGVAAFFLIAGYIYGFQFLLTQVIKLESEHPIMRILREDASIATVGATILSATVVAPLFEEYLFRYLLQGWLTALLQLDAPKTEWEKPDQDTSVNTEDSAASLADVEAVEAEKETAENPYAPLTPSSSESTAKPGELPSWIAWLPNLFSSSIFALLHFDHGASFITLFFFSLVLGFLYQRRQRLLPCIVVHFLLNAMSLALLLASVWLAVEQ